MPCFEFQWSDEIIEHLADHGIDQDGFETVVCDPVSYGYSRSSGRNAAWGYTADGRYIMAVYDQLDELVILPVTAYEVPEP